MGARVEEKDFEEIYAQTYLNTFKFITIHCYNIADLNDILQDTYVEFYKILRKNRDLQIENRQAYINGIAKNIIKRYGTKKKLVGLVNDENEDIDVADTFDLEQNFITKQDIENVWNYIKKKDLMTAKIFYLYSVLGLKIAEIARELEVTESNVKNKIYRTQKEIRKYLGKDVIENE